MGSTEVAPAGPSIAELVPGGGSLCLPMSYDDYAGLGETHHDEYYDGARWVNPPNRRHAQIAARLTVCSKTPCRLATRCSPNGVGRSHRAQCANRTS